MAQTRWERVPLSRRGGATQMMQVCCNPHQGEQEKARRRRQMAAGKLKFN